MWGLGFILAYEIVSRLFKKEGYPENWADKLFIYCILSSVIGARLGHCLFYEWDYYGSHPAEIFKIWKRGLASHGGVFALILALVWYSKTVTQKKCLVALRPHDSSSSHRVYVHPVWQSDEL